MEPLLLFNIRSPQNALSLQYFDVGYMSFKLDPKEDNIIRKIRTQDLMAPNSPLVTGPSRVLRVNFQWPSKGHFTHKTEGPWPLQSKSSHWSKVHRPSKFTSHTKVKA